MKFLLDPHRIRTGVAFYGEEDVVFYVATTASPLRDDPHTRIERLLLCTGHAGVDQRWAAWKVGETLLYDEPYMETLRQQPRERLPASSFTLLPDLVTKAIATMDSAQKRVQSPAPQTLHHLLLQLQPLLVS